MQGRSKQRTNEDDEDVEFEDDTATTSPSSLFDDPTANGIAANSATTSNTTSKGGLVCSKFHQMYGAVACQIHARGVHTDLITTVDIAPDGKYVFFGVSRGAMELYAVNVKQLEEQVRIKHQNKQQQQPQALNILDFIHVVCHSDAKLKGFGACTNMIVPPATTSSSKSQQQTSYLLLTGKGIKNIHIWKFTPPSLDETKMYQMNHHHRDADDDDDDESNNGTWEQLYDTPTNGNTIVLLDFYRTPKTGRLMAISKSDTQKLRLWDLSYEEEQQQLQQQQRPKKPKYQDVANSHAALGIAGGFCVCGGDSMYNELSIVSLDQPKNEYNHTELALPSGGGSSNSATAVDSAIASYSSRRQRRGEMKAVVNVAAAPNDSSHALLELDDVS